MLLTHGNHHTLCYLSVFQLVLTGEEIKDNLCAEMERSQIEISWTASVRGDDIVKGEEQCF